jgi:hypothetical protein
MQAAVAVRRSSGRLQARLCCQASQDALLRPAIVVTFLNFLKFFIVMDPLTALSLAGTLVQFIDFGSRLLSAGQELYKSASGNLAAEEELQLLTADLKAVVNKIRPVTISHPSEESGPITEDDQKRQKVFETICDKTVKVAQELINKLDKVKIEGTKHRKLKTLHQLIMREWSREEIDGLVNRLSALKEAFDREVLVAILYVAYSEFDSSI